MLKKIFLYELLITIGSLLTFFYVASLKVESVVIAIIAGLASLSAVAMIRKKMEFAVTAATGAVAFAVIGLFQIIKMNQRVKAEDMLYFLPAVITVLTAYIFLVFCGMVIKSFFTTSTLNEQGLAAASLAAQFLIIVGPSLMFFPL
jgi:hypothetical protein